VKITCKKLLYYNVFCYPDVFLILIHFGDTQSLGFYVENVVLDLYYSNNSKLLCKCWSVGGFWVT